MVQVDLHGSLSHPYPAADSLLVTPSAITRAICPASSAMNFFQQGDAVLLAPSHAFSLSLLNECSIRCR
jgi:hypothetical protein